MDTPHIHHASGEPAHAESALVENQLFLRICTYGEFALGFFFFFFLVVAMVVVCASVWRGRVRVTACNGSSALHAITVTPHEGHSPPALNYSDILSASSQTFTAQYSETGDTHLVIFH